jgi:hypothetical protein
MIVSFTKYGFAMLVTHQLNMSGYHSSKQEASKLLVYSTQSSSMYQWALPMYLENSILLLLRSPGSLTGSLLFAVSGLLAACF